MYACDCVDVLTNNLPHISSNSPLIGERGKHPYVLIASLDNKNVIPLRISDSSNKQSSMAKLDCLDTLGLVFSLRQLVSLSLLFTSTTAINVLYMLDHFDLCRNDFQFSSNLCPHFMCLFTATQTNLIFFTQTIVNRFGR